MPHLLLVKHSHPASLLDAPAREWHLSETGRTRCQPLAERLRAYEPQTIFSSVEPKAVETAQIVAGCLGLTTQAAEGLHEHERSSLYSSVG
jgi:broad specificity phosphatase PhoE